MKAFYRRCVWKRSIVVAYESVLIVMCKPLVVVVLLLLLSPLVIEQDHPPPPDFTVVWDRFVDLANRRKPTTASTSFFSKVLKARINRSPSKTLVFHPQQLHSRRPHSSVSRPTFWTYRIHRVWKGSRCFGYSSPSRHRGFQRPKETQSSDTRYRSGPLHNYTPFRSKYRVLQERWRCFRGRCSPTGEIYSMWLRSLQTIRSRRHNRPRWTCRTAQRGLGEVQRQVLHRVHFKTSPTRTRSKPSSSSLATGDVPTPSPSTTSPWDHLYCR